MAHKSSPGNQQLSSMSSFSAADRHVLHTLAGCHDNVLSNKQDAQVGGCINTPKGVAPKFNEPPKKVVPVGQVVTVVQM